MKSLKLSLEDLRIETFETTAPEPRRGTVRAHEETQECIPTIYPCPSIDYTACVEQCPQNTDLTECYCGGPSGNSCVGPSCAYMQETCFSPCRVSDLTNCHRC
jgi:hypothetical protein